MIERIPEVDARHAHERAIAAARTIRIPFHRAARRGRSGAFLGAGTGSSIDFHDHRAYQPGDDPRYIDWPAYARTESYTMKLYRPEVSPRAEIILDCSASTFLGGKKASRSLELLYLCAESARTSRISLRVHLVNGESVTELPEEALWSYRLELPESGNPAPAIERIGLSAESMRIMVSDLLFPASPFGLLAQLTSDRAQCMILCPFDPSEAAPDWAGNVTFVDCETGIVRRQFVDSDLLSRYRLAYERHFAIWREESRRCGALLARISSEGDLVSSLFDEAIPHGAVEL